MISPKGRFLSTAAINLSVTSQWMSLLFIPATTASLVDGMGFTIAQIGALHSMRLLSMFFSLPVFAWLCYYVHRGRLLALTLAISSLLTIINTYALDYPAFMAVNLLTGLSLGAVHPVARSLIPAFYPLSERGTYFGLIELASGVGGFIGVGLAVVFDQRHSPLGDWKSVYTVIGILQLAMAIGCLLLLEDPGVGERPSRSDLRGVFSKWTFIGIVSQGMLGAFPWAGFTFLIPWYERIGMGKTLSTLIFASVAIGAAVGGLVGGWVGDKISKRFPLRGRSLLTLFSVMTGVVFAPCLLAAIPHRPEFTGAFIVTGGLMGLFISWPAANIAAIQSDIFPENLHPTSFAIQFWLEGSFSALSPMFVALLNDQVFGCALLMPPGGEKEWLSFSVGKRELLLKGMANSLITVCCVFWLCCAMGVIVIYRNYPLEKN
jgi:MFS family permease